MHGVKAAWRAEAEEQRDRRLERLRKFWLVLVAAVVLLPPYLWGVLAAAGGVVYICIRMVRWGRVVGERGGLGW